MNSKPLTPWQNCPECDITTVNPATGRCVICKQSPAECFPDTAFFHGADIAAEEPPTGDIFDGTDLAAPPEILAAVEQARKDHEQAAIMVAPDLEGLPMFDSEYRTTEQINIY